MQLQEQETEKLTLITLNVDFDKSSDEPDAKLIERMMAVLRENQMTCENLMSTTATENILAEFDLFGLPAALIFDGDGNLVKSFDGETEGLQAEVLRIVASL